jgi:hypothetical protein
MARLLDVMESPAGGGGAQVRREITAEAPSTEPRPVAKARPLAPNLPAPNGLARAGGAALLGRSSLFALLRNVGLAIGVSVTSVLTQSTQIVHSQIAASLTAFNRNLQSGAAYLHWSTTNPQGFATLNAEVTRQASIIAYVNDFKPLFAVSLLMLPLVLLMRRPGGSDRGQAGA